MTHDEEFGIPRIKVGPIFWLSPSLRSSIEDEVSRYRGGVWRIKTESDLSEFAYHRCAVLSDGSFDIFFKYSEAAEAKPQFNTEISDLNTLAELAGVSIPNPISLIQKENGWLLITEALKVIERGPLQWKQIGETLARIHRVKCDSYGFEKNGYWGPLIQNNTPAPNWITFFEQRRLHPLLGIAIDSGNLPSSVVSQIEKLIPRLPELCGPETAPTLLHGDAQQNNFICTAAGTFVIDPAVYFGHPEMDLALIDSFQTVPDAVFDGYREQMPIDPGFSGRRDLWRIPLYLAAVALEGPMHINCLTNALRTYL